MNDELLYRISLTLVPGIGDIQAKLLIEKFGSAGNVFYASKHHLEMVEGIGFIKASAIKKFCNFKIAENEIKFIEQNNISALYFKDVGYPVRLTHYADSPVMLYYKGNADLNSSKIISVIGTRNNSTYGKEFCEAFIKELPADVLVVSGLAYGIDTIAHKEALKNNLKTVGVVAHGLHTIYPFANKSLSQSMLEHGGLLTDFFSFSKPDRENFPKRNRIIAGMCDAVLVVESGVKGGSIITAEIAVSYNKDIFAIPGKINDEKSKGCNSLIKRNIAQLVTTPNDISSYMNWKPIQKKKNQTQRQLFVELSPQEEKIASIIRNEEVSIDKLLTTGLSSGEIAGALLSLEMQGLINSLPGKRYSWVE